jgi:hypothetical protein
LCTHCLASQFAAIVFHNPFHLRFLQQLKQWLPDSDTESSKYDATNLTRTSISQTIQSDQDMLEIQNQAIEQSFQEMKEKAMPEKTRFIFDNQSLLQHSIEYSWKLKKRLYFSRSIKYYILYGRLWKKVAFQESSFKKALPRRLCTFK